MKCSLLSTLLALAPAALASWPEAKGRTIQYSTVTGHFLQDETDTVPGTFDYASWNFGLLNRTYPTDKSFDPRGRKTQWERFERWVAHLNGDCKKNNKAQYKLLVMGRHGEGWHNAAETFYGTPAWNCYWSEESGNGTAVWADALLTPAGYQQAYKANAYFKSRFEEYGMPPFESYYSSPLSRCVVTADVTFANLSLPRSRPFDPVIKEYLREGISIHTCDRRSSKAYIHELAPHFRFEKGFAQTDELWRGTEGETADHQLARSKEVLDDIFTSDEATWISITSHSGEIGKLLATLGHRTFSLSTGQIIPVLVKAEVVEATPTTTVVGFTPEATCEAPPVTSIAGQGCVCSTAAQATATG